jgi:hypothetical protein
VAESFLQLPPDDTGKKTRTYDTGTPGHDQYMIFGDEHLVSFRGRACTFRTPGRAGTAGQKIFAIHNAVGSTTLVDVTKIVIDAAVTTTKIMTSQPPLVRVHRFTTVPTSGSGTQVPKVALDTTLTSNASVTCWGNASADGTNSGVNLAVTIPANSCVAQEYAPRQVNALITSPGVGYEMAGNIEFLVGTNVITLRAGEGLVVFLGYTLAAQNPITDMWSVMCRWQEYTLP